MKKPLVINIGLHKTGTTSLAETMIRLGCHIWHGGSRRNNTREIEGLLKGEQPEWEIYTDSWFLRKNAFAIASQFPSVLFIATTRELDTWMTSVIMHKMGARMGLGTLRDSAWIREPIDEVNLQAIHRQNTLLIRDLGFSHNVLELPLEEEDKLGMLCEFLGKIPEHEGETLASRAQRIGVRYQRANLGWWR